METLMSVPATIAAAAVASFFMVILITRFARARGMLAYPGQRQSHDKPTPTGGGAGIVATIVIGSVLVDRQTGLPDSWMLGVLPGIVALSLIGWVDDRRHVSSGIRLLVQTLAAALFLWLYGLYAGYASAWNMLALCIVLVGVMNAYNFMDGSDGMAAFQAIFAGLSMTVIFMASGAREFALLAALLTGACTGFVPVNFPRARVFMGDSGSVPLGFSLGSLMLIAIGENLLRVPEALLLLSLFLVDSSLTLLNRVIHGERWYTAHKQHIYQRLIAQGWTHSRVLLLYQAINIVLVAPVLWLARMYPDQAWTFAGLMFLLLSTSWYLASLRLEVRN